ncbi:uncharacterized protein LOC115241422 isoform X1 [Formica exsecta]|uniref:uncharacterized protein LOC115241422 isoform X1 n=1 Tax=Formica exsecta TaxID=72781 RepID=UPI001143B544|nr:uncharacterized protein LOC115241422 isoform X1 [Formica exsecta]
MTSLILTLLPVATASAGEVKHSQYGLVIKMATSTEITLIDAESNESYMVTITLEDAERARNDIQFATNLLEKAKRNCISNKEIRIGTTDTTAVCENSISDNNENNKENEDTKCKGQHNWTKEETMLLIDIYTCKEKDFHSRKSTVKHCWETVSKELKKMGYDISAQKCCIKEHIKL